MNKQRLADERAAITEELEKLTASTSRELSRPEMLSQIRNVYDMISDSECDQQIKGRLIRSIVEDIVYDKEHQQLIFHFYFS